MKDEGRVMPAFFCAWRLGDGGVGLALSEFGNQLGMLVVRGDMTRRYLFCGEVVGLE
jgi:hypothetical protein